MSAINDPSVTREALELMLAELRQREADVPSFGAAVLAQRARDEIERELRAREAEHADAA
jgi:hypothetical protein